MKKIIVSFVVLWAWPAPVVAANEGAWSHGYEEARALWSRDGYPCDDLFDVTHDFWPDVRANVYPDCETKYKSRPSRISDCKDGAKQFAWEKAGDCIQLSQCSIIGEDAAGGIVEAFCDSFGSEFSYPDVYPPVCQEAAKNQCVSYVMRKIQRYAREGECGSLTDVSELTSDQVKELNDKCEEKVKDLLERQSLRW